LLEQQASVISQVDDRVSIIDSNYNVQFMNDANIRFYNKPRSELIGMPLKNVIGEERFEKVTKAHLDNCFQGKDISYELDSKTAQGDDISFHIIMTPFRKNNQVLGAIALLRDISELRKKERALAQKNTYLQALHDTSLGLLNRLKLSDLLKILVTKARDISAGHNGYIYLLNKQEKVIELAAATGSNKKHIGYKLAPGEGVAGHVWQTKQALLLNDVQTNEIDANQSFFPDIQSMVAVPAFSSRGKVIAVLGFVASHPNAFSPTVIELLTSFAELAAVAIDNAQLYSQAQLELKARKLEEKRFRVLFENAPVGALIANRKTHRIHSVNQAMCDLLGYTQKEFLTLKIHDITHPDDQHIKPNATFNRFEKRYVKKDGSTVYAVASIQRITKTETDFAQILDITEHKKAEKARRDLSQRIVTVQEEERKTLARELHDEIGQSLTALKVGLHSANKFFGLGPEIDIIDGLLTDIRTLSLNLHPAMLEDLGLVSALRWLLIEQTNRAQLSLRLDFDVEEPFELSKDLELAIYRISQEALTNIVRHAKASSVNYRLSEQDDHLLLSIKDDGVGMVTEAIQAKEGNKTLGLRTMHERTLLQDGRFELQSSEKEGTAITVVLPKKSRATP